MGGGGDAGGWEVQLVPEATPAPTPAVTATAEPSGHRRPRPKQPGELRSPASGTARAVKGRPVGGEGASLRPLNPEF